MPLRCVTVSCNAKINLYLRVFGRRPDGFHNIETVFHSISLNDTLRLSPDEHGLSLEARGQPVPQDASNLAVKAAERLLKGKSVGARIEIDKRIPVGAGLGGGSADAAGTILGLDRLYGLGTPRRDMMEIARDVGSDVAFMLDGGCAVGTGRGEMLRAVEPLPEMATVLVIPSMSIDTGWAYNSLKMRLTSPRSDLSMITNALERGDVASLKDLLWNDFEGLIFEKYPLVQQIKQDLLGCGAVGALMSGSGPVVYGLFDRHDEAEACTKRLSAKGLGTVVCSLAGRGVTIPA
jgi:4-diphosphocytidyl-2-C-methyl-D-erythritol kinase